MLTIAWVWSNVGLVIVLSYGPIKHFEGSVIWNDGWKPIACIFILPIVFGAILVTVLIPYVLLQHS